MRCLREYSTPFGRYDACSWILYIYHLSCAGCWWYHHNYLNSKICTMSTLTVTSSLTSTPSTAKYDKDSIVTIDEVELSEEEDGRTSHDTNASYVLPNE
jgi:hypothetical protein